MKLGSPVVLAWALLSLVITACVAVDDGNPGCGDPDLMLAGMYTVAGIEAWEDSGTEVPLPIDPVGGTVEVTTPQGPTRTEKVEAGSVAWRPSITHDTKNIGGNPIEGLVIEIK